MRHFLSTADWSRDELAGLLELATDLKADPVRDDLRGKSIALMFLNPSMRTRTSFDLGMQQLGGIAIVLQPGKDAWGVEFEPGAVMEGEAEEHIAEVAGVLSRYCDLIGIRAFPKFQDWSKDREDSVIRSLAQHASVPVINMETIVHPCQDLALMQTLRERLGELSDEDLQELLGSHPSVDLVHMCGSMARMDKIVEICNRRGIILLEDTAQSLGAFYKGRHL